MKTCKNCKNKEFKDVTRRHVIKTRHTLKSEIVIENLPVQECKICGSIVIPESSEKMIEILRKQIRKEIEETSVAVKTAEDENLLQKVFRTLMG